MLRNVYGEALEWGALSSGVESVCTVVMVEVELGDSGLVA